MQHLLGHGPSVTLPALPRWAHARPETCPRRRTIFAAPRFPSVSSHAITGTCRSIDARHTPRYLAGYEWRYNRRFELPRNLERLARVAVTVAPKPYRQIAAVRPKGTDLSG